MIVSKSKENILKRIRQALAIPVPLPFPESEGAQNVFVSSVQDNAIVFAEEFTKLQGKFAFCANEDDLKNQLNALISAQQWSKIFYTPKFNGLTVYSAHDSLSDCDASITDCEVLVARTGTIVLSAAQEGGRTVSVYAPVHICIAYTTQLVYDIKDGLQQMINKYPNLPSMITFASGPSRTADIEKTLVTGVHGPKEVYCFLVDDSNLFQN